jgi:hypothetical protein
MMVAALVAASQQITIPHQKSYWGSIMIEEIAGVAHREKRAVRAMELIDDAARELRELAEEFAASLKIRSYELNVVTHAKPSGH